MERSKSVQFSISGPPSEASSRSQSPAPSESAHSNGYSHHTHGTIHDLLNKKSRLDALERIATPGRQGQDVYDRTLPRWRSAIRRTLVASIEVESKLIAKMQDTIRTPWLDAYFVYTSSLGTHTFFMILLPAFFFFGYGDLGRGLLTVLAFGVYLASFIKDLLCSPRPFAPPVTRLTIGSHHLEYGFPSTHSTNSVSIALFFFGIVHRLASSTSSEFSEQISTPLISSTVYAILCGILTFYTFSIVFGRLYTAMHSFTDCIMGILLGAGIWWAHTDWEGILLAIPSTSVFRHLVSLLGLGRLESTGSVILHLGSGLNAGGWLDSWVRRGGWEVPLILIPICLLAVHKHPQPVDDCPCFEDAIAFASVVLGAYVSEWAVHFSGATQNTRSIVMPGSGWVLQDGSWIHLERGLNDILIWWGVATLKMVVGVLVIFTWRIVAKSALHLILPPTFRLLARFFRLPRRRFYTPATEYKSVPSEFHSETTGGFGLRPIPSVIDLPSAGVVGVEVGGIGSGADGISNVHLTHHNGNLLKTRNGNGNGSADIVVKSKDLNRVADSEKDGSEMEEFDFRVKHYDADVLTKVIVYAGIAVLASEGIPLVFNILGLGVRSWIPQN
ncbi:PAP2 superfamily-domain-containing protein [Crepidotus variabilis]|uniref:PAP2 superfamily-domain-containing protein n=1 Tax=Crepidotus variabilis TaxID=179855 RepID=A0A9P6JPF0_9AGAR|nr:PAP2 superfamily-domain-containing protein [Crepidotus variabilis]